MKKIAISIAVIVSIALLGAQFYGNGYLGNSDTERSFQDFKDCIVKKQVTKVIVVNNDHVEVYLKPSVTDQSISNKSATSSAHGDKIPAFTFKISTEDQFNKDLIDVEKELAEENKTPIDRIPVLYDKQVDYKQILFPFILLFIIIGAIILIIYIIRSIFCIPVFLSHQKAQTKLLAKIAEKNGVSADSIKDVLNEFKI